MKDNGRKMQITKSGDKVLEMVDGAPSIVLSTKDDPYISLTTFTDGATYKIAKPADIASVDAKRLLANQYVYDICSREEVVVVYGVSDAQLNY